MEARIGGEGHLRPNAMQQPDPVPKLDQGSEACENIASRATAKDRDLRAPSRPSRATRSSSPSLFVEIPQEACAFGKHSPTLRDRSIRHTNGLRPRGDTLNRR